MNSSVDAYGGQAANVVSSNGGTLPVTGFDLLIVVVGALLIIAVGVAMMKLAQRS